jgi:hypothetical protein
MTKKLRKMAEKLEFKAVEPLEGEVLQPLPRGRPPDYKTYSLKSVRGVARELARVYRNARAGLIKPEVGARLTYILGELRQVLSVAELEQRLEATTRQVLELRARIEELRATGLPVSVPAQLPAPEEDE